MHYQKVRQDLTQHLGTAVRDEVPQPARVLWPKVELPAPRAEQLEALSAWTRAGCRGQVIMPTGTGKTEVALAAMAQTQVATLVVAPIRDLMYQWHRRILKGLGGIPQFDSLPRKGLGRESQCQLNEVADGLAATDSHQCLLVV
jgi:superfamily II DNA or RNA helicase